MAWRGISSDLLSLEDITKFRELWYQYIRQPLLIKQWASIDACFLDEKKFSFFIFLFSDTSYPNFNSHFFLPVPTAQHTLPERDGAALGLSSVPTNKLNFLCERSFSVASSSGYGPIVLKEEV
jgi:hypothetical protein